MQKGPIKLEQISGTSPSAHPLDYSLVFFILKLRILRNIWNAHFSHFDDMRLHRPSYLYLAVSLLGIISDPSTRILA